MPAGIGYGKKAKTSVHRAMKPGSATQGTAAMLNRAFDVAKVKAKKRKK